MIIRVITTGVLLLGAFIAPWWVVFIGIVVCVVAYRRYIEGLIPAVAIDVMYGAQSTMFSEGFVTFLTLGLLVLSLFLDRYFRHHVRL